MAPLPPPPPPGFNPPPPEPTYAQELPEAPGTEAAAAEAHAPAAALPPEPATEIHEADVLKRRKKFSWKAFGGDGFMVSVAVHVLLAILGIFYVISKYQEPPKKPDADVFSTGAGGGNKGDKAKAFEHKLKNRNTQVKLPSRIVSKTSTSAVTLPSTPSTNTAAFATGLASGGMSKGAGGGSGGGEGTGVGIGKGGGRNFVSIFGAKGLNAVGLPGTFYDCKQTASGGDSLFAEDSANGPFIDKVLRAFVKNWDTALLEKFFKSPNQLTTGQIFISARSADEAPKAYEVADKCKGKRWVAHYKGTVSAPKSGKFRFVVLGDDTLVVRFNGKIVADGGWTVLGLPGYLDNHGHKPDAKKGAGPGLTEDSYKGNKAPPFRCGTWIDVVKGRDYPMELILSEIPGGGFGAWMMMEEADPTQPTKGDGKLFLFRMNGEDLPEGTKNDTGLSVDMTGRDLIWKAKNAKSRGPR